MQTSGSSRSKFGTTRVVGMLGLALTITGSWIACSPGNPDCKELGALCNEGGQGGGGNTGGTGGDPPMIKAPPSACGALGVTSTGMKAVTDFETKFIVPKCGQAKCHGPGAIFEPKKMDVPEMIRPLLVGKKAITLCKSDYYINKDNFMESFMLQKVLAMGETLNCPTPGVKPDSGGTRMPNKDMLPGTQGERLSDGELECFTWWVEAAASL